MNKDKAAVYRQRAEQCRKEAERIRDPNATGSMFSPYRGDEVMGLPYNFHRSLKQHSAITHNRMAALNACPALLSAAARRRKPLALRLAVFIGIGLGDRRKVLASHGCTDRIRASRAGIEK
jgi:hypothetical protein